MANLAACRLVAIAAPQHIKGPTRAVRGSLARLKSDQQPGGRRCARGMPDASGSWPWESTPLWHCHQWEAVRHDRTYKQCACLNGRRGHGRVGNVNMFAFPSTFTVKLLPSNTSVAPERNVIRATSPCQSPSNAGYPAGHTEDLPWHVRALLRPPSRSPPIASSPLAPKDAACPFRGDLSLPETSTSSRAARGRMAYHMAERTAPSSRARTCSSAFLEAPTLPDPSPGTWDT